MLGEPTGEILIPSTDTPQSNSEILASIPSNPVKQNIIQENKAVVDTEVREANPFESMSETIGGLVRQIQSGVNTENSKSALSKLLHTREHYYRDVAVAINPDIQPVDGKDNVYRVGETEMYGSISAMLDATPALAEHKHFANQLRLLPDNAETVTGEQLQPRSLIESVVVYGGSNAQDRIQPFSADIDMHEYIRITTSDRKSAINTLADALQRGSRRPIVTRTAEGEEATVHLNHVSLGFYREGPNAGKPMLWTPSDLQAGFKEVPDRNGVKYKFSLQEACANPSSLSASYLGVTANTVFEVQKVIAVLAQDTKGHVMFNTIRNYAQALQEVYFSDPSSFKLIDRAYNADDFVKYVTTMENEIREKSTPGHINKMKLLKRMYNLYKANGDLKYSQELSHFFSEPIAAAYQLHSRYKLAREAIAKGLISNTQLDAIKSNLLDVVSSITNPLAREPEALLRSKNTHHLYDIYDKTMKQLINSEVDIFLDNTPAVKATIESIRAKSAQ